MSRRSGTAVRATHKPVIVLAGEDANDRACLRVVLEASCPAAEGRIVEINRPVRLRDAGPEALKARIETLARLARARARRENAGLAGMFIHEDLDRTDGPKFLVARDRVQQALTAALGTAYYVLAVPETEAWLLLFPEALTATVSSWNLPASYRGRDTGLITDPKRVLTNRVSSDARRYREANAPAVLQCAADLALLTRPVGTNRSWHQFHHDIADFCGNHL